MSGQVESARTWRGRLLRMLVVLVSVVAASPAQAADEDWQVLAPTSLTSPVGSTFTLQDDGSFLVSGPEQETDVYVFELLAPTTPLAALRLEALPDASLPKGGAGRSQNSNFCVTEVELELITGRKRRARPVPFETAFATRADSASARRAADGDPKSYWVVHGSKGEPSVLVLPLKEPLSAGSGDGLRITIRQESQHGNHALGRFRLSTTESRAVADVYLPDLGPLAARVDDATWRGIQFLLARQHPDGTWFAALEPERHLGMTALCAYALAKSGVPERHSSLQRALAYLETHPPHETYDASLRILWHTSADPVGRKRLVERAAAILEGSQGLYFNYEHPAGGGDLSNHQFGVVALDALDRHGFAVDRKTWERLAGQIARAQTSDRGWGYRPAEKVTPTMSIAGLAVAAACRNGLVRRKARSRLIERAEASVTGGIAHVGRNWLLDAPRSKGPLNRWFYYGCYGMERAAALAGVTRFGEHEWYPEVATIICDEQKEEGSWANPWVEKERNTAFCLLTLSRATAATGVPSIPARFEYRWTSAGVGGDLGFTAVGAPGVRVFLAAVGASVRERFTWDGDSRPRVAKLRWLLDGKPLEMPRHAVGDATDAQPKGTLPQFETRFTVPGNGDYELVAVASFVPPGRPAAEATEVRSEPLALRVSGLVDAPVQAAIDRLRREAKTPAPAFEAVTASSAQNDGEFGAKRAFDRSHSTRWVAKADDERPTLTAAWKRPMRVAEIRLLPALHADHLSTGLAYDTPKRVVVLLNGKEEHTVEMSPDDALRGATLAFKRPVALRRIEVRIETRDAGPKQAGKTGWREIQLLGPR